LASSNLDLNQDGDNYTGHIANVVVNKTATSLNSISFNLSFSTPNATLDDIFAGQETVTLRNDFSLPCMDHEGSFASFTVKTAEGLHHLHNGALPPRYKPVFSRKRVDRITDLWKSKLDHIIVKYIPPPLTAEMHVETSAQLTLTLHITTQKTFTVYMQRSDLQQFDVDDDVDKWDKIVDLQQIEEGKNYATFTITLGSGYYNFMTLDGRVGLHGQL
jgi:hypothetical protein